MKVAKTSNKDRKNSESRVKVASDDEESRRLEDTISSIQPTVEA